jgi:hypothetical protein
MISVVIVKRKVGNFELAILWMKKNQVSVLTVTDNRRAG